MRSICLLSILLLAACASPVPVSTPKPAADAGSDGPAEPFEGTFTPTAKEPPLSPGIATLQEVRTSPHPGFDRMVFEFREGLPGYEVRYLDKTASQCGSGEEVRTDGAGQILVRLHTAQAHTDDGKATVAERDRALGLPAIKQAKLICDFEGYVDWVLGVADRRPFRVMELSEPARLIVDVRH
jgi:hypothetical protein